MRIHRGADAVFAVPFVGLGVVRLVAGDDRELGALWVLLGLRFAWSSTRERPPEPEDAHGPGPLAPSGTGRFRASGWPPSKDPSDYR